MEWYTTTMGALKGRMLEKIKEGDPPFRKPEGYRLVLVETGSGHRYWVRKMNLKVYKD